MSNVKDFPLGLQGNETRLDLEPNNILEAAVTHDLREVVIVGYEPDGSFYFASSRSSGPETLWMLAQAQRKLLEISE